LASILAALGSSSTKRIRTPEASPGLPARAGKTLSYYSNLSR
jgi:hypothetical protein